MESLNINSILKREHIYNEIKNILMHFEKNTFNYLLKRGIYIYGAPGSGKTEFITRLLKDINYDIINYDAGDIRNKSIIDSITRNNMSNKSVISMFSVKPKPIAIIMDEIDGMNNGDKGGINTLIKLIRQKKTKKQKLEETTYNPIICIGSYHQDKKIKELTKVCNTFELQLPTDSQIMTIVKELMPGLNGECMQGECMQGECMQGECMQGESMQGESMRQCTMDGDNMKREPNILDNMITFINGDLRKVSSIYKIYQQSFASSSANVAGTSAAGTSAAGTSAAGTSAAGTSAAGTSASTSTGTRIRTHNILNNELFTNIFKSKTTNEDTKLITKRLINNHHDLNDHITTLSENDRTIVGLLWHENIIDNLAKVPTKDAITFYSKVLDNICFADYMDRITFQHQIWQFNEMSSLIKTFHCNKIYHDTFTQQPLFNPAEVRFTKVLTKYSSEYNNATFINDLCQSIGLDKKDTFALFLDLQNNHDDEYIKELLEKNDISKLYVNRIYRYMDKCIDETAIIDGLEHDII
jgi:hypothetical protein